MSAEKPEIGEIWRHNKYGTLSYIAKAGENYIEIIGLKQEKHNREYFTNYFSDLGFEPSFSDFVKCHSYLGKSKVNINDLFEVEDD